MKKISLISTSLFALMPFVAEAQTQEDVFKLGEISVSVSGDETTTVGSRNTVSAEEIGMYTNSDTLESAITLLPGVTATQVGRKNETSVSIRGFEMRQVNVMIDGVQSATPYDYYPDLARYSTTGLSEVQVSKGLSSVLNGPNTLGGIINMVTKKPTEVFEGSLSFTAKMGNTGAYNGFLSSMDIGGAKDNWFVQASASYSDISRWSVSDDFKSVKNTGTKGSGAFFPGVNENGGFREGSSSQDLNTNFKIGYAPNETDEYVFGYSYADAKMDIPVYAGQSFMPPFGATPAQKQAFQLTRPFYRDYPYLKKQSFYALSNTALGETGYVKTKWFYDIYKNRMDSFSYTNAALTQTATDGGFPSLFNDYDFGASIETGADLFENHTTKTAFHYRKDVHRSHTQGEPVAENSDDTYSVALEDVWHVDSKTDVIVGASYDWLIAGKSENYNDKPTPHIEDLHQQDDDSFNPMVAVRHNYSETGTVFAGVAQKSRFATLKSRYGTRTGSGTGIANPYLKDEKSINYEVGFTDTFSDKYKVDMAAFYNDVRDTQIERIVNVGGKDVYQTENLGKSRIYGVELASVSKLTSTFDLGVSYTFMMKELTSQIAKDENLKPTNAPKHTFVLYGDWRVNELLSVVPTLTAYSSRYSTIGGNNMVNGAVRTTGSSIGTGIGQQDGTKIPGFFTAGLKVSYEIWNDVDVSFGVDNIFDENYELSEGYPEEGRNYYVTLDFDF